MEIFRSPNLDKRDINENMNSLRIYLNDLADTLNVQINRLQNENEQLEKRLKELEKNGIRRL